MEDYKDQLRGWIEELRWGAENKYTWETDSEYRVRAKLFTSEHSYSISATPTYLGCIASARKPRPGEDWTRGNDLADGKFNKDTWIRILEDIVGYELLKIAPKVELHEVREEESVLV